MNRPCLSLFPLLITLSACSSSTEPDPLSGLYVLQTINDEPLPFVRSQIGQEIRVEVMAGHIRLNDGGTCSARETLRTTVGNTLTTTETEDDCTWTGHRPFASPDGGIGISITSSDGETSSGRLVGATLTFIDPRSETVSVYAKQ